MNQTAGQLNEASCFPLQPTSCPGRPSNKDTLPSSGTAPGKCLQRHTGISSDHGGPIEPSQFIGTGKTPPALSLCSPHPSK